MRLTLHVADIPMAIHLADEAAPALRPLLERLFDGFMTEESRDPKACLEVTFAGTSSPLSWPLAHYPVLVEPKTRGKKRAPLVDSPIVYRNGLLSLQDNHPEYGSCGRIEIYPSSKGDNPNAVFYTLFFVFLSRCMVRHGRLMVHGAGLRHKNRGFLFLGDSGSGKTSMAGTVDPREVLSDDSPVISKISDGFILHPSPYSQVGMFMEKGQSFHHERAKLARMLFLHRSNGCRVAARDPKRALAEALSRHVHFFDLMGREERIRAFEFCTDLFTAVPVYDLYWKKGEPVWHLVGDA